MRLRRSTTNSKSLRFILTLDPRTHGLACAYLDQHFSSAYIAELIEQDLRHRDHVLTTEEGMQAYERMRSSIELNGEPGRPRKRADAIDRSSASNSGAVESGPIISTANRSLFNAFAAQSKGTEL
jgi:hypothetical protein